MKPKKDKGQQETERILSDVEKRINEEYKQATKEIEEKLNDYLRRFELKDKKWQEWVEDGTKTEAEYKQWRLGQMAVGKRWSDLKEELAHDLVEVNDSAKEKIMSVCPEVYADNYNFETYQVEQDARIDTGFTKYSKESVEKLMKEDPDVLPPPGKKVSKDIADGKAVRWNRQKLQSVMIQGILQGESIPNLATRLSKAVGDSDRKAAIRNARTMATRAQNAGRVDAHKRAENMGVELVNMWLATFDNRTRTSHRHLDHKTAPVGEKFENGLEYPGDPKGDPEEIYNCRCSIRGVVKGLEPQAYKYRDESVVGMTYEEWLEAKPESQDILHQEKAGKAIKAKHIREYGGVMHENTHYTINEKDTQQGVEMVMKNKAPLVEYNVTPEQAYQDYFEYENAQLMKEYSRTGIMPHEDINGDKLTDERRGQLMAEADYIQNHVKNTGENTLYRGLVMNTDEVRAITPNDVYKIDSLTSTSTDEKLSSIYSNIENNFSIEDPVPVMIKIQQSGGIIGFRVDKETPEIILPKGQEYRVVRNYMDRDGVVHLELYASKKKNKKR